jgi:hypothetical protein
MFHWIRQFRQVRRLAKVAQLIDRTKQCDEVLIGCRLAPDTRQRLQHQRDELESQIRVLRAT